MASDHGGRTGLHFAGTVGLRVPFAFVSMWGSGQDVINGNALACERTGYTSGSTQEPDCSPFAKFSKRLCRIFELWRIAAGTGMQGWG